MKILAAIAFAATTAIAVTATAAPAGAMPAQGLSSAVPAAGSSDLIEDVRHGRRWHRHHRGLAYGAGGFAAGAILGAALASQAQAQPQVIYGGDWHAYCASKYRSYDPYTGTFLGYDGRRHPCR